MASIKARRTQKLTQIREWMEYRHIPYLLMIAALKEFYSLDVDELEKAGPAQYIIAAARHTNSYFDEVVIRRAAKLHDLEGEDLRIVNELLGPPVVVPEDYSDGYQGMSDAEMAAESAAERHAESAWLRHAEGGSAASQRYRDEVDQDLRRCGEPGL